MLISISSSDISIEIAPKKPRPPKTRLWIGLEVSLNLNAVRHLASRKWDASNAWHAVASINQAVTCTNGNNCACWIVLPPDGTLNDILYFWGSLFNRILPALWLSLVFRITKSKLHLMAFTSPCPFPTLGPTFLTNPSVFLLTPRRRSFTPLEGLCHSVVPPGCNALADCTAGLFSLFRM